MSKVVMEKLTRIKKVYKMWKKKNFVTWEEYRNIVKA